MKNQSYSLILIILCMGLIACEEDSGTACDNNFAVAPVNVTPAFCGQDNGSVSFTSTGQNGSVTYQLDNGAPQPSADFTGLAPGSYQITARDEAGCTTTATVDIQDQDKTINLQVNTTGGECGEAEGVLTVEASGGDAPYEYSLDGTNFVSENQFQELEPSEYTVTVRDKDGCTTETTAVVHSNVSFSNTISNIISTNCAVSGCHNGNSALPNFTDKEVIFARAQGIKNRTSAKTMPPPSSGRSLSEEEIEQIACWVNDGASDN